MADQQYTCIRCQRPFVPDRPSRRFCSKRCAGDTRRDELRITLHHRFWDKVGVGKPDECWPWLGGEHTAGYGGFSAPGIGKRTHRIAVALVADEPVAAHLVVCHSCDNPGCCNPNHLFVGTHQDNRRDCNSKGRFPYPIGEKHHHAKLTDGDVRAIRADQRSHPAIAAAYGVSKSYVWMIKQRRARQEVA